MESLRETDKIHLQQINSKRLNHDPRIALQHVDSVAEKKSFYATHA